MLHSRTPEGAALSGRPSTHHKSCHALCVAAHPRAGFVSPPGSAASVAADEGAREAYAPRERSRRAAAGGFPLCYHIRDTTPRLVEGCPYGHVDPAVTPARRSRHRRVFLVNLLAITYVVDLEQLVIANPAHFTYPAWPPRFAIDADHWWGRTFDPLQLARPVWWKMTIWIDVLLFGPFYVVATYAYLRGRAWIASPAAHLRRGDADQYRHHYPGRGGRRPAPQPLPAGGPPGQRRVGARPAVHPVPHGSTCPSVRTGSEPARALPRHARRTGRPGRLADVS